MRINTFRVGIHKDLKNIFRTGTRHVFGRTRIPLLQFPDSGGICFTPNFPIDQQGRRAAPPSSGVIPTYMESLLQQVVGSTSSAGLATPRQQLPPQQVSATTPATAPSPLDLFENLIGGVPQGRATTTAQATFNTIACSNSSITTADCNGVSNPMLSSSSPNLQLRILAESIASPIWNNSSSNNNAGAYW